MEPGLLPVAIAFMQKTHFVVSVGPGLLKIASPGHPCLIQVSERLQVLRIILKRYLFAHIGIMHPAHDQGIEKDARIEMIGQPHIEMIITGTHRLVKISCPGQATLAKYQRWIIYDKPALLHPMENIQALYRIQEMIRVVDQDGVSAESRDIGEGKPDGRVLIQKPDLFFEFSRFPGIIGVDKGE